MCTHKTNRFRIVEVDCETTKQEYTLLKDDVLDNAKQITAIEAYKVGDLALAPSGRATVNDTVLKKSFLTLSTSDTDEVQYRVPLIDLVRTMNNGQLFLVNLPKLAFSKCKVYVPTTAALSATESWVFGVHYE